MCICLLMETYRLTVGELPKISGAVSNYIIWGNKQAESGVLHSSVGGTKFPSAATENAYGATISISFGDNQHHNNVAPCIAAYCWQRTS